MTVIIIGNNQCECGVFSLVRDILQWNVAGLPLIHQVCKPNVTNKS